MRSRRSKIAAAFTLLEIVVAAGLFLLVFSLAYVVLRPRLPEDEPFVNQKAVAAVTMLENQIGDGIELLSPAVGSTGPELTFRDVSYRRRTLRQVAGRDEWATFDGDRPEEAPNAIRLSPCARAMFTVLSPTLATAVLTVGEGRQARTFMTTLRLKNGAMAR